MKYPKISTQIRSILSASAAASLLLLSACSGGDAATSKIAELRVGDQLNAIEKLLEYSGQDGDTPYRISYANFSSGPPIIAAQTGGSLDVGYMAETPMVFAQAAGSPVKIVAVLSSTSPTGSPYALVVKPDSPIKDVSDLKGKSVAYGKGTVTHYLVARALATKGLKLSDINSVNVSSIGADILGNGADALTLGEPILTRELTAGNVRVLISGARPVTPGFFYLVASEAALNNPEKSKQIADFITRTVRAEQWRQSDIERSAPALAAHYRVTEDLAKQIIRRNPQSYTPITDDIIAAHQQEADLFYDQGLIRQKLDVRQAFDTRFNDVVAAALSEATP